MCCKYSSNFLLFKLPSIKMSHFSTIKAQSYVLLYNIHSSTTISVRFIYQLTRGVRGTHALHVASHYSPNFYSICVLEPNLSCGLRPTTKIAIVALSRLNYAFVSLDRPFFTMFASPIPCSATTVNYAALDHSFFSIPLQDQEALLCKHKL